MTHEFDPENFGTLGETQLGASRIATSPTAFALYQNVIAAFQGAVGAPRLHNAAIEPQTISGDRLQINTISGAQINADAIAQSELKTSTGTVSTTNSSVENLTLPGGQFGLYPQVRITSGGAVGAQISGAPDDGASGFGSTSFATNISLAIFAGGASSEARQRFITASPPFDLGDGEMQGFLFVLMRSGAPVATYSAIVPPWAYNGPTDLRVFHVDEQGRTFGRRPKSLSLVAQLREGRMSVDQCRERRRSPEFQGDELVEITQAVKNADMGLIPHPFASAKPGDAVILLDPMDELVADLLEAQEHGEGITSLITGGRIRPDNEALRRAGPPGVMQCRIRS